MKKISIMPVLIILFLTSCATYSFVPLEAANIKLQRYRGIITPIFIDNQLGVGIVPQIIKSRLMLLIFVKNNSNSNLYMADSFFNCYTSNDNNKWELIKRYSSKEFYKQEYDDYGYGRPRTTSRYYVIPFYESTSTTDYYDPTAAELDRLRNQSALFESYTLNSADWLWFLESNLFYERDLSPTEIYSGIVFYDFRPKTFLKVTVSINQIEKTVFTYQFEKN